MNHKKSKKRIRFTIINDEGDIGVKINDIFNEWILIKNEAQSKKWKEKALKFRAGTYEQFDLLDMVNKLKDESKEEAYLEKVFIKVLKRLLCTDDNKQI